MFLLLLICDYIYENTYNHWSIFSGVPLFFACRKNPSKRKFTADFKEFSEPLLSGGVSRLKIAATVRDFERTVKSVVGNVIEASKIFDKE